MLILSLISGVLLWTLVEYFLHRFAGHEAKRTNFFKTEHVQHHAKFNYFAPITKKVFLLAVLFVLFSVLGSLIFPLLNVLLFLLGFLGMACIYELTHFRYHSKHPVAKVFIVLRKHHFYHHFHNPKVNYGVTSRIWDRVFGTFTAVEKVNIPDKMLMGWLVEDNQLRPEYEQHFRIKKMSHE